jgi:hypothetical protein
VETGVVELRLDALPATGEGVEALLHHRVERVVAGVPPRDGGLDPPVRVSGEDLLSVAVLRVRPLQVTCQLGELVRLVLADYAQRPGELGLLDDLLEPP